MFRQSEWQIIGRKTNSGNLYIILWNNIQYLRKWQWTVVGVHSEMVCVRVCHFTSVRLNHSVLPFPHLQLETESVKTCQVDGKMFCQPFHIAQQY